MNAERWQTEKKHTEHEEEEQKKLYEMRNKK